VVCARCNGDGAGCQLSQIPELMEECSTMRYVMAASAFENAQNDNGILPVSDIELPYDWEQCEVGV
jgi:hypothetical protein